MISNYTPANLDVIIQGKRNKHHVCDSKYDTLIDRTLKPSPTSFDTSHIDAFSPVNNPRKMTSNPTLQRNSRPASFAGTSTDQVKSMLEKKKNQFVDYLTTVQNRRTPNSRTALEPVVHIDDFKACLHNFGMTLSPTVS